MLCIHLDNPDPYYCLAAEEYLLRNYTDDIFMLWQSHDTVVVGKHQNAMGEINCRHVRENGIRVARRISGGGTVFHDRGNVNFTFIKSVAGSQEISFKRFTQPIVDVLATMGIHAVTSGRNDLLVGGLKISGNAEHVFKNRVLHHGTLLFHSDLENLGHAIRVVPGKYVSKAVQSNRSQVVNIADFLEHTLTTNAFIDKILIFQLNAMPENRLFTLTPGEEAIISRLSEEKFKTWEWQYGYSPTYTFSHECSWQGKLLKLDFSVEKGRISRINVGGDVYSEKDRTLLHKHLPGIPHDFDALSGMHGNLGLQSDTELIYCWF